MDVRWNIEATELSLNCVFYGKALLPELRILSGQRVPNY